MSIVAYLVSALAGLYGLGFLIFAFTEPPSSVGYLFRAPSAFYFVPEKGGRFLMAVVCFAIAGLASFIVSRIL